jgi:hypothetical protein
MCNISGRIVGRQPEIMPIDGSTEDQMKTSLLAQLMSLVRTSRVIVMMRYMEAKQTLLSSVCEWLLSSEEVGERCYVTGYHKR